METFEALIAIHETERCLYRRMIDMGRDALVSKKVMAFWLWLESEGHKEDIVKKIYSRDIKFLALVCVEAEAALASLQPNSITAPTSLVNIPITSNLANRPLSLYFIFQNKERITKGISDLFNGVCSTIFKDILEERGIKLGEGSDEGGHGVGIAETIGKWVWGSFGEGTSQQGLVLGSTPDDGKKSELPSSEVDDQGAALVAPLVPSNLDPSAQEWHPWLQRAPEEDRCLFITFSNGYPLTEFQIITFFTKKYGVCVERVYVHWPDQVQSTPLFGKIVFHASIIPALILNGQEQIKFTVEGRTLWCKKFRPKTDPLHDEMN